MSSDLHPVTIGHINTLWESCNKKRVNDSNENPKLILGGAAPLTGDSIGTVSAEVARERQYRVLTSYDTLLERVKYNTPRGGLRLTEEMARNFAASVNRTLRADPALSETITAEMPSD